MEEKENICLHDKYMKSKRIEGFSGKASMSQTKFMAFRIKNRLKKATF